MVFTDGSYDGLLGYIKGKACCNFEKGFEHGDWSDSIPRFFAEGFDEAPGPDLDGLIWNLAGGPGHRPEAHGFGAIRGF